VKEETKWESMNSLLNKESQMKHVKTMKPKTLIALTAVTFKFAKLVLHQRQLSVTKELALLLLLLRDGKPLIMVAFQELIK